MNLDRQDERETADPLDSLLRSAFPDTAMPTTLKQELASDLEAARANWPAIAIQHPRVRHPASHRLWWGAMAASVALVAFGSVLFQVYRQEPVAPPPEPAPVETAVLPPTVKPEPMVLVPVSLENLDLNYCLTEFHAKEDPSRWTSRRLVSVSQNGKRLLICIADNNQPTSRRTGHNKEGASRGNHP